jgi:hypothetical protein
MDRLPPGTVLSMSVAFGQRINKLFLLRRTSNTGTHPKQLIESTNTVRRLEEGEGVRESLHLAEKSWSNCNTDLFSATSSVPPASLDDHSKP